VTSNEQRGKIRGLTGKAWWKAEVDVLPHLPPTTDPLLSSNHLSFQQHSRYRGLSTFVFIDIPALPRAVESRPFVFIDIPALLLHFLKLLRFLPSLSELTSCPRLRRGRRVLPTRSPLKRSRQRAVGGRQSVVASKEESNSQFTLHHSQFRTAPARTPVTWHLNPVSSTTHLLP